MLMDGFLVMTDVLEPQRLFLPAALPVSASLIPPSGFAGGVLLPAGRTANHYGVGEKYAPTELPQLRWLPVRSYSKRAFGKAI